MAKADSVEHTHIWADKYDSSNHWKYCTVCGAVKDKEAHAFTDHWAYGYESCSVSNSDTKTCSCGYSYVYHKPHEVDYSKIAGRSKSIRRHSYGCKNCNLTTAVPETCTHNGKPITCKNYGACDVCGLVYTQDEAHNVTTSTGTCAVCGKRIYTVVGSNFTYSSDYKKGQFEFRVIPGENVEIPSIYWYSFYANGVFTDTDVANSGTGMYNTGKGYTLDSDGKTRIYRWNFSFTKYNSAYYYLCMSTKIGDANYHNEGMAYFTICQDREAPIISEIKQTDQASSNGWATIKQLNVSGTENATKYVTLSIFDKSTGKKLVDAAKLVVSNNSWSYECTPPLEGDVNGRIYICKVVDDNGNTSTKEFTIYKTDGTSPQIESPLSYTDWTNTAKTITLMFTDYGSGDVQASLDNQTSYKACTKTADGKYQITYTFSDDIIGNKTYKLYLRDGLGNAGSYDLVVGNIDKNTYSITYNLNGGTMSGQKTSYTVADSFTLPTPTKTGYTFTGWTGSNGATSQKTVTVNKGTRGNLNYTANWQINTYIIDANGILNEKDGGNVAGYATIDVYINGKLDAENVIDYCKSQPYGTKYEIRYKANDGYVFVDGGNNGIYSGTITNDVSFYPVFKTKVLTTTFHRNRNSSDTVTATQKYTYGIDGQTFSDNGFDYPGYKLVGYDLNKNAENPTWSVNNGVAHYWIDKQYPANDIYAIWKPISWTTKYDANGGSGTMADTMHRFNGGDKIRHNQFTRPGWTMTGWTVSRVRDGVTEWLYGASDGDWIDGDSWYELGKNPSGTNLWVEHNLDAIDISSTYIDGDVHIMHAQWRYIPISVKVPQILTGDHTGRSQFRVKCDDMKAGNIKVSVPSSFIYKQTGKADVTATITSKSGSGVITPANKVCVYDITTKSGLSAGCWQGSFNIGLTLTKE